ncbi:SRPBCC family protein [Mycolicibacterium sp. BiH015]|uniref:SRPBCC family protein n=1 Tax=Mycolicibacterium sp. BiH015 TaxID=3018808 RepID=UPI0022E3658F|nr:SRPBCC family protein [Mycolicibacterium sp. BiH015]MDA2890294.1 SRPBCC family protein [Mycolicibacterium sp. BiH015]
MTTADFPIAPAQLFEVLSDTPAWPEWFDVVKKAAWKSPAPYGVGSTRIILMRGEVTAVEEFIAWETPAHLAFRFNECSDPRVRASAEDYRIEPTAQGCRLTWTMAQNPVGASWFARWVARRVMKRTYGRALVSLRRYTDQRFGTVL